MTRTSSGRRLILIVSLVLSGSGSARTQVPDPFPLTLNEIDPGGGVQFVELHNRGAEVVSLEEYSIAMVNIDGDGQFDPADIPSLVAPVVAGGADMATASRFLDKAAVPDMPAVKRWGNRRIAIIKLLGFTLGEQPFFLNG